MYETKIRKRKLPCVVGMYVLCDKGIYPGCRVVKKFMCFCVLGDDKEKFFNFRSRGDYKRAVLTAAVTLNAKVCNLDVQMTKDDEKKEKSGEVEVTGKRKEPQKKSKFRGRKEFDEKTGKGEEDGAETYFGYHMSKFNPETDFLKDCIKKIYNVNRKKKDDDTRYYTQPNCSYLEQYENLATGFHPAPRNHEGIVIEPTIGHVIYDMMRLQPTATEIPAGIQNNCFFVSRQPGYYEERTLRGHRDFLTKYGVGGSSKSEPRGLYLNGRWVCLSPLKYKTPSGSYYLTKMTVPEVPITEAIMVKRSVGTIENEGKTKRYTRIDFMFDKAHEEVLKKYVKCPDIMITFFIGEREDCDKNVKSLAHGNSKTKNERVVPLSGETRRYAEKGFRKGKTVQQLQRELLKHPVHNVQFRGIVQLYQLHGRVQKKIAEEDERRKAVLGERRPTANTKEAEKMREYLGCIMLRNADTNLPAHNISHLHSHQGGLGFNWSYTHKGKKNAM